MPEQNQIDFDALKALLEQSMQSDQEAASQHSAGLINFHTPIASREDPYGEFSIEEASVATQAWKEQGINARFTTEKRPEYAYDGAASEYASVAAEIRAKTEDPEVMLLLEEYDRRIGEQLDRDEVYSTETPAHGQALGRMNREALKQWWGIGATPDERSGAANLARGEEEQAALGEKLKDTFGVGLSRTAATGFLKTSLGLGSLMARATMQDELADKFNRQSSELEGAATAQDVKEGRWAKTNSLIRGAGQSVAEMAMFGGLGTAAGIQLSRTGFKQIVNKYSVRGVYTGFGLSAANRSITEGRDAGLRGVSLVGYAASVGVVESAMSYGIDKFLTKTLGTAGVEDFFLNGDAIRASVSAGYKAAAKHLSLATVSELAEENAVELTQSALGALFGATPESLTPESILQTITDTTLQTLLTLGASTLPMTALNLNSANKDRASRNVALTRKLKTSPALEGKIAEAAARTGRSPELLRALPPEMWDADLDSAAQATGKVQQFFAADPANVAFAKGDAGTLAHVASIVEHPSTQLDSIKGDETLESVSFQQDQLAIHAILSESNIKALSPVKTQEALETFGMDTEALLDSASTLELMQSGAEDAGLLRAGLEEAGVSLGQLKENAEAGQDTPVNLARLHALVSPENFPSIARVIKKDAHTPAAIEIEKVDRAAETKRSSQTLEEYQNIEKQTADKAENLRQKISKAGTFKSEGDVSAFMAKLDAFDRRFAARGGERGRLYDRMLDVRNAAESPSPQSQEADDALASHLEQLATDGPAETGIAAILADPEAALTQDGWFIVTATQEAKGEYASEVNVKAREDLRARLTKEGAEFVSVEGVYKGEDQGENLLVMGTEQEALALGAAYGQESVLTNRGLVYSDGSGQLTPSTGLLVGEDAKAQEFHSVLPNGKAFSFALDFDNTSVERGQEGTAPTSIKAAVEAGKPFKLIHWSNTEGLKKTAPSKAGSAGAGAERASYAKGAKKRTHFGLLGRYTRESAVAARTAYEVEVSPSEVYDLYSDPEGFMTKARGKKRRGENPEIKALEEAHKAAREAGYKFFYSSGTTFPSLYTLDSVSDLTEITDFETRKALMRPELEQAAYHGTKFSGGLEDFGAFSTAQVNNTKFGEGAQAFGWGLYFTNSERIAKSYRDSAKSVLGITLSVDGASISTETPIDVMNADPVLAATMETAISQKYKAPRPNIITQAYHAARAASKISERNRQGVFSEVKLDNWAEDFIAEATRLKGKKVTSELVREKGGRLAKVDIPDSSDLLQWDLPLDEQPETVKKALDKLRADRLDIDLDGMEGQEMYQTLVFLATEAPLPNSKTDIATFAEDIDPQKEASEYLASIGINGLEYPAGTLSSAKTASRNFVIWDDKLITINEFEQSAGDAARGSVKIAPAGYLVSLFDGADLSTLSHEFAHIFLNEYKLLIESGSASQDARGDWSKINKWLKMEAGELTTEQHEKFAAAWEQYELEGRAPSKALVGAFQRFSNWMKEVYKSLQHPHFKNVRLTDEVRGVFDRMLASEEEMASAVFGAELSVRSEKEVEALHMSEEQKAHVNGLLETGRKQAEAKLTRARNNALRPLLKKWRREAKAEVNGAPVYKALSAASGQGGLRWSRLKFDFGADTVKALRDKHTGSVAKKADAGALPETLAVMHGFESSDDMIVAMLDAPKRQVAEADLVDQKLRDHDLGFDPFQPIAETQEFAEALEVMAEQYGRMAGVAESVKTRAAIKAHAAEVQANMPLGQALRIDIFLGRVRTSSQKERRATLEGDWGLAVRSNERARLSLELARLSGQLKESVEATVAKAEKAIKPPRKGQRLPVDKAYMDNIAALLRRFGMTKRRVEINPTKKSLTSLLTSVDDTHDISSMFDDELLNEEYLRPYRKLSTSQFENLSQLLSALDSIGRAKVRQLMADEKTTVKEVVDASVELMGNLKNATPWFGTDTTLGKVIDKIDGTLMAPLTQMDFLLKAADNYNGARVKDLDPSLPMTKHIVLRGDEADADRERRYLELNHKLSPHLTVLGEALGRMGRRPKYGVPFPEATTIRTGQRQWTNDQILAIALNSGNLYNAQAVAKGNDWTVADEVVMPPQVLHSLELFNANELHAIQGVWDSIDTLWADTAKTHEALFGFAPAKVKADPVTVTSLDGETVTLEGGYYPLRFDSKLSTKQAMQDESQAMKDMFEASFAPTSAKKGHTVKRTDTGGKPVLLDPSRVLRDHMQFAISFVTHGQYVRDTNRILTNPQWSKTFIDKFGSNQYSELNGWLRGQVASEYQRMTAFDSVVEKWRPLTSLYVLGLRMKGFYNQMDAIAALPADIGVRNYLNGVARLGSIKGTMSDWHNMMDNSTVMRERLEGGRDREMHDLLTDVNLSAFAKANKAKRVGQKIALAPIIYPSLAFEFVGWNAMYHKHIEAGLSPREAVTLADHAVLNTQPATRSKDLSRMQRDKKGAARLLTMLMSFSMRRQNANSFSRKAMVAGEMSASDALVYGFLSWIVAPVLPTLALAASWNDWDEDELLPHIAEQLVSYQVQGIPLATDAVRKASDLLAGRHPRSDIGSMTNKGIQVHYSAIVNLSDALTVGSASDQEEALWALADLASFYFGIPVVRAYNDLTKGAEQFSKSGNPAHLLVPQPRKDFDK